MSTSAAAKIANLFERVKPLPDSSMSEGWAKIFGVPINSSPYYEGLLGLHSSFERFRFELDLSAASHRAKALYYKASEKLEPYTKFQTFNNLTVDNLKKQEDSIDLMFLAADVTEGIVVSDINPITLEAITSDLTELLSELDTLEIDERLRRFLKLQIGNLLHAIAAFDAIGIEGLSRIYGATASEMARACGMKEAKQPSVQGWMVKARSTLKLIGAGVVWLGAVAGGADSAIEHGRGLLEFAGLAEPAATADHMPE